nr:ankyrin repeat domain-containing protein [uncultured Noviherbaspirillum sp.]
MDEAHIKAVLLPLYRHAGGRHEAGVNEMLHRIADDGSHLLRLKAFPVGFEAAALEAVACHGAQMDKELRLDLLALACEAGFSELAAALLQAGIAWREGDTYQCMVQAIRAGRPATLALLLQAGIDACLCDEFGTPLLTHAIAAGDAAIVGMLRKAGARADSEGSALSAAAVSAQPAMIRMCVDDGASSAALGDALDQAAMAGRHQAVIQLLQAGAPVDPALLRATQRGDDEMADLICTARSGQLLAAGAGRLVQR